MWIGPVWMGKAARLGAATVCLLVGVAGCDSASEESATASASTTRVAKDGKAAKLAATMVAAVSTTGPEAASAVDVKFELAQRPEVGKPVDIALVFVPASALDRLYAKFSSAEGLEVVKGEETEQFARPVVGAALTHTVTVVPRRNGIFSIQATVLTDSDSESVSRTFSIPLIAGSGIAEWSPRKAGSGGNDTG